MNKKLDIIIPPLFLLLLLRDIAAIKEKVEAVEGRLDSVDTELISLKIGQKEMGTDIRAIKDRLEVKEEIYALKEQLSAVESEIGKVRT